MRLSAGGRLYPVSSASSHMFLLLATATHACRMVAYHGSYELKAKEIFLQPAHNLPRMAWAEPHIPGVKRDAQTGLRNHALNRDGWGIGWMEPSTHLPRSIRSPHSAVDQNNATASLFSQAVRAARGPTLFGHVRACTDGGASHHSSHPFVLGPLLFMHNGGIAGFRAFQQQLWALLRPGIQALIKGDTDSEYAGALVANNLRDFENRSHFGPTELRSAVRGAVEQLKILSEATARGDTAMEEPSMAEVLNSRVDARDSVCDAGYNASNAASKSYDCVLGQPSSLNFVVSDGVSIVATRYRSNDCEQPPSLYYRPLQEPRKGQDRAAAGVIISSEPLDDDQPELGRWWLVGKDKLVSWSLLERTMVCECLSRACASDLSLNHEQPGAPRPRAGEGKSGVPHDKRLLSSPTSKSKLFNRSRAQRGGGKRARSANR